MSTKPSLAERLRKLAGFDVLLYDDDKSELQDYYLGRRSGAREENLRLRPALELAALFAETLEHYTRLLGPIDSTFAHQALLRAEELLKGDAGE